MYQLKTIPEDFRVIEESAATLEPQGEYCYALLQKKNCTTADAVMRIATALNIPAKRIGYAGQKDKVAVTTQLISLQGITAEQLKPLSFANLTLTFQGYGKRTIGLGDLLGNRFVIVARNLDAAPKPLSAFPNYFDSQRFSDNNAEVGKLMLQRNFSAAAAKIHDPRVQQALRNNPQDPISALRTLPPKILMLYAHAYQSMLFNRILAAYLQQFPHDTREESFGTLAFPSVAVPDIPISVPGFGFSCDHERLLDITTAILAAEQIRMEQFVVRELPGISCESVMRAVLAPIQDLKISPLEPDDMNLGKQKCTLSFLLPKGSYATMAVRAMFTL